MTVKKEKTTAENDFKRKLTFWVRPSEQKEIDTFCKEVNISRSNFLAIASKWYIKTIRKDKNLLSLAFHGFARENWTQNAVINFLAELWEVYSADEGKILKTVLDEFGIEEKEFFEVIATHGFDTVNSILMKCMEIEFVSGKTQHSLK